MTATSNRVSPGQDGASAAPADTRAATRVPAPIAAAVGVLCAALGLAPSFAGGLQLPLQNIWEQDVLPEDMPLALLPLGQYDLLACMAMMVVGAALTGIAVRVTASRGRALPLWWAIAGAGCTQAFALSQSAVAVSDGLEESTRATIYLAGMVVAVAIAIVMGFAVAHGVGRGGPAGAAIAGTVAAIALGTWITALVAEVSGPGSSPMLLLSIATWLPATITGAVVGVSGVATARRAVASATALALLWVLPAAITAVSYAIGSRIYLQHPEELLPAGLSVFTMAVAPESWTLTRLVIAVAVAVAVGATRRTLSRRSG